MGRTSKNPLTTVYGISIATELANRGLRVAVVARDLPEDDFSTGFASPWAVCYFHVSLQSNARAATGARLKNAATRPQLNGTRLRSRRWGRWRASGQTSASSSRSRICGRTTKACRGTTGWCLTCVECRRANARRNTSRRLMAPGSRAGSRTALRLRATFSTRQRI